MTKKQTPKLKTKKETKFIIGEAVRSKKLNLNGMVTNAEVQLGSEAVIYHVLLETGETRHFTEKDLESE